MPGDTLHVLNMGGILGRGTGDHPDLGPALRVEVLGAALVGEPGRHARIQDHAIESTEHLATSAPLVFVSGTAMNTGKTYAAASLVAGPDRARHARRRGQAHGRLAHARRPRDAGRRAPSPSRRLPRPASSPRPAATWCRSPRASSRTSTRATPDVLVLELGDGIIGPYGVDDILQDMELQRLTAAHVLAATDLAGAWAADQLFRTRYRSGLAVVVGPATDTEVGRRYVQNTLGVAAVNARAEPDRLSDLVAARVARFVTPDGRRLRPRRHARTQP